MRVTIQHISRNDPLWQYHLVLEGTTGDFKTLAELPGGFRAGMFRRDGWTHIHRFVEVMVKQIFPDDTQPYETELKPCPFCGEPATYVNEKGHWDLDKDKDEFVSCPGERCLSFRVVVPWRIWQNRKHTCTA